MSESGGVASRDERRMRRRGCLGREADALSERIGEKLRATEPALFGVGVGVGVGVGATQKLWLHRDERRHGLRAGWLAGPTAFGCFPSALLFQAEFAAEVSAEDLLGFF